MNKLREIPSTISCSSLVPPSTVPDNYIDKFPTTDVWISKATFPAVFGEVFERTFIPSVIIESFPNVVYFP